MAVRNVGTRRGEKRYRWSDQQSERVRNVTFIRTVAHGFHGGGAEWEDIVPPLRIPISHAAIREALREPEHIRRGRT